MLSDIAFPKSEEYRTGTDHEPLTFYLESLTESTRLDLLLGYFSSSALRVLAVGFAKFISNGGRARLIINHVLSGPDKQAVLTGTSANPNEYAFSADDFQALRKTLDSYGHHFFACVAWLIASDRMQIRAIRPTGGRGIAHYKSGIFSDGTNKVKFRGSCNFTASGLLENLEELDVKLSWKTDADVFDSYEQEYNALFTGTATHAKLIPFAQIEEAIVREYGGKDLDELLTDEAKLAAQQATELRNKIHQTAVAIL